jgi:solute:Na+ symporter, SSS family
MPITLWPHADVLAWFLVYLLGLVGVNAVLARRIKTEADFFVANRQLGPWLVAISFVASWFGASSTMGQVQKCSTQGVAALWLLAIPGVLSCVWVWLGLSHRVAQQGGLSLPWRIEQTYGRWAKLGLAGAILLSNTAFIGSELIAVGNLFGVLYSGLDRGIAIAGFAGLVLCYAAMAGFWTVLVSDLLHFALFTLAVLILGWGVLGHPLNPLEHVWHHPPQPLYWAWHHNLGFNAALTLVFVLGWGIDPLMWQRMSAVKTPAMAKKAAGLATGMLTLLLGLVAAVGLASPALVNSQTGGKALLAHVVLAVLPPWLATGVFLGVLTALASTIDSCLNIASLTLTHDVLGTVCPQLSQPHRLRFARLATVIMILPAGWLALHHTDIIKALWIAADVYVCALFWPLMGILFSSNPSPTQRGAGQGAMALGWAWVLAGTVMGNVCPQYWLPWPYSTLVGWVLTGVVFGWQTRSPFKLNTASS